MTTISRSAQLYLTSLYAKISVTYRRPYNPPYTYTYFFLCDRHEILQHPNPAVESFLKFNNICYLCPACPQYLSEHFHYETESCTEKCTPLRIFYSPCLPVDEESVDHECQLHHYPSARISYCDHYIPFIPPHAYTPHFPTQSHFERARQVIFRATRLPSEPAERILLGLPNHDYDDEWRLINSTSDGISSNRGPPARRHSI
jgi:hypothetical protein